MKAKTLWHTSSTQSEIRTLNIFPSEGNTCLVKAAFSMISTGTERTVALANVPQVLYGQMKVPYLEGDFSLPIKYGYSIVGEVISRDHALYGQAVHLMHPHQSLMWVNENTLSPIPEGIPMRRATLVSNLETALTAVWDAGLSVGDKVMVCGFGMIGALLAMIIKQIPAVALYIDEPNPERQALARSLGLQILEDETQFDMAFHTSGTSSGLQACIDKILATGKVIELSWYGDRSSKVYLGGDFHSGRKQIIASQVSNIPADRIYRWTYARRKEIVFFSFTKSNIRSANYRRA